jgi:AGCS family alanine or glycine:cation symporter
MNILTRINDTLNAIVWGPPLMILLMGTGVLLTIVTGAIQIRKFGFAFREVFGKLLQPASGQGSVTPFQALATALASTVGVGNIAGVSTAIYLGGPGALFWLLVSGFLGMSTKFAEIAIALHYREPDASGTMRGGAMYVLSKRLGLKWLGSAFALMTALAAFGIGNMVQANSVAEAAQSSFGIPPVAVGLVLAALTGAVILGGIKRIAEVTQFLVPFMCVLYVAGALVVLLRYASSIGPVALLVIESAFTGHAAAGGFAGASVTSALRYGVARGLFSNEAGLGSAPMVHSSAQTDHPVRQASYGIIEVFIDSVVICLLTGFVVLATGAWQSGDTGAALAGRAFSLGLPGVWGHFIVSFGLILFAFSTIIGWAFYGETGIEFLLGTKAITPYRILWILFVFVGATGSLQIIWSIADTLNGMMALPNLVGLLASIPLLRNLIPEFFANTGSAKALNPAITK